MNIIKVDCLPLSIFVGYERENDARGVTFDYSAWAEQYGDGVLQLLVQRPGDADPYPVVLTAGGNNTAVWLLSTTDTAVKGQLEIQLIFTVGSVVAKTAVLPVLVDRSLAAGATPPDPYETWLETLTELAEQILHTTQPPEIRNGYWYIFDPDTGEYVNSGVKAEGEDGVGITGAQLNADYTLTLNFSDGTSYTTPSIRGAQGETGPTPQLSIGTVTTGAAGSSADVEITGTPEAPVLNFTIPRGDTGEVSEAELQAALLNKADVITDTASGAIASFPDGAAAPVKALTVAVEPIQDLHGYDNPWPPGGGVNLLPSGGAFDATKNGIRFVSDGKGTYTITGTATADAAYDFAITEINTPSTVYIHFLNNVSTYNIAFVFFNGNSQIAAPTPVPVDAIKDVSATLGGKTVNKLRLYVANGYTANLTFSPMLCIDDTVKPFTPYSNICPISGHTDADVTRTGKNLIPNGHNGDNGYIASTRLLVDGTTTADSSLYVSEYFSVKEGIQYTWSGASSLVTSSICFYDASKNFISGVSASGALPKTITTPANSAYARANQYVLVTSTYYTQLELGSTATAYEPYTGDTYSITFPTSAGTVYGGTLDVLTGVLTVDMVAVDMGSLAWENRFSTAQGLFTVSISDRLYASAVNPLCSIYPYKGVVASLSEAPNKGDKSLTFYYQLGQSYRNVYIYDTAFSEATDAEFKAAMEGQTLCYELATPVEISLTPEEIETLKGTNNFWSDAGDVSVEYRADTKLYIEKKITAAIAAALNS